MYPVRDLPSKVYFDIYFLDYTKSIYIETFIQTVAMFMMVKLLYKFLTKVFANKPKAILVLSEFEGNTSSWFMWTVLLGENMLYLSFACGVQSRMFFSGIFQHKLNMSIAIFCFYFLLIYCICFYQFTFNDQNKRVASNGLFFCRPTFKGFLLESVVFGIRNLLSGFIHGYLLDHHDLQLYLLIGVNGLVLLLIVRMRKEFAYKLSFFLTFCYYLGFTLFNASLLSQKKEVFLFEKEEYPGINFLLIVLLLTIIVLRVFAEIIIRLIEFKKGCEKIDNFLVKEEREKSEDHKTKVKK